MARHLLIASATWHYLHLPVHEERPQLSDVLASVVRLFTTTLGSYDRELEIVAANPTAAALCTELDRWFAAAERDPSDWVVFYYTGHAELVGSDSLYLLTTDFKPGLHPSTAFRLGQLADMVMPKRADRRRSVRNLLVIVDTCFAGEGVRQLVDQLHSAFRTASGGAFYVLGAALPRQEAKAGALASALVEAIDELSRRHVQQRWLYFDQILPAINQKLRVHESVLGMAASPYEEPQFFPNPSARDTGGLAVPADQAQRAISDQEFRDHWDPRARGVEFDTQPGVYFSGRRRVLDKLATFLTSADDHRTRVITGQPGSGKSAILSQVVVAGVATARSERSGDVAPVDLAVHAKNKSLLDISRIFAQRFGGEPQPDTILERLRERQGPIRIVVDALDEAAEPAAIATRLLGPLNEVASVKLLVGTQTSHLRALAGAEVIDIDTREHAEPQDIARYVKARLMRADEPGQPTPYADREDVAERVAAAVESKAYPNFLVARLIVEDLLLRSRPANPDSAADVAFPSRVATAFDAYLARFGDKEAIVRDIFRPLAYAEGQGLPWDNIWAPLASAMARRPYRDDNVRWVLEHAGAFILESVEDGRSVYRLYHQALADALRKGRTPKRVDAVFTKVLTAAAARRADGRGIDWLLANRYLRTYLARHAARCGALGRLVTEPFYLLAADPEQLLPEISAHGDQVPHDIAAVYKEAVDHIRTKSPAVAASYLELIASQRRVDRLAKETAMLPLAHPWRTAWTRWTPRTPGHSFGKDDSRIETLEVARLAPGRPVALVGRENGAAEVWDVALGKQLVRWCPGGVGKVRVLALLDINPEPLLVVGWSSGHLGVRQLAAERSVVRRDEAGRGRLTAMCLAERHAEPVCIVAYQNLSLVVRALPSLDVLLEKSPATESAIYGLRVVADGADRALVSVGDSPLRVWSPDDLSILWDGGPGKLTYIEEGRLHGRPVFVVSLDGLGPLQVWDVKQRCLLFEGERRSARAWLCEHRGRPLLIQVEMAEARLTAQVLASRPNDAKGRLAASDLGGPVDLEGGQFSSLFELRGRAALLGGVGDHVRVWDVDDLLAQALRPKRESHGEIFGVRSLLTFPGGSQEVYAAGAKAVCALDAAAGVVVWKQTLGPKADSAETICDIAIDPERECLVASTVANSLHVLDLRRPTTPVRIIRINGKPDRVCIARWRGQTLAFATVKRGQGFDQAWALRIWDLDTGDEVPTSFAYQLSFGQQDKWMRGLALAVTDKSVRAAFASSYAKVIVADFVGPIARCGYSRYFEEWEIPDASSENVECLAAGEVGHELLLAAGTAKGHVAVWDFMSGVVRAVRVAAHSGGVPALCFGRIAGEHVLISGGRDEVVRIWTVGLDPLVQIEIGDAITAVPPMTSDRLAVGSPRGLVALQLSESAMIQPSC